MHKELTRNCKNKKRRRAAAGLLAALLVCVFVLTGCGLSAADTEPFRAAEEPNERDFGLPEILRPLLGLGLQEADRLSYSRADGTAIVSRYEKQIAAGRSLKASFYDMPASGFALAGSLVAGDDASGAQTGSAFDILKLVRSSFSLHWCEGGVWNEVSDAEGLYSSGCIFLETPQENLVLYMPKLYEHIENDCVHYLSDSDGYLDIRACEEGWEISLKAVLGGPGTSSDFFFGSSEEPVIDWEQPYMKNFWSGYTNDGDGRMLYTGYYWISASTYRPTGPDVYSNCTACYLGKSFLYGEDYYPVMKGLYLFIQDAMLQRQNEAGFWASESFSTWLNTDYGVGTGYYDTRFNSDLARILLTAYEKSQDRRLKEALERYADFYSKFANECGWEAGGGIFVPDYYHPDITKTPHCALNHQLAEIEVLWEAGRLLERPDLIELADRMLTAIEGTAKRWIMPNNNLEYGIFEDGHFGLTDYPYLTYNDLYDVQEMLGAMGRPRSAGLDLLMNAKKIWMDRNGVTEYKK